MAAKVSVIQHRSDGTKSRSEMDLDSVLAGAAASAPIAFAQMPLFPVQPDLAATGSTIGDAAALTGQGITFVTGADGTKGIKLLVSVGAGGVYIIFNRAAAILKLYPDSATGKINDATAAAALSIAANTACIIVTKTAAGITNSLSYSLPLVPS